MNDISLRSVAGPPLLTAEEAAAIARCSIKTVRRAYNTGALTAYRRRGSRAVLLDRDDVVAWAQGELLQPARGTRSAAEFKTGQRSTARRAEAPTRARKLVSQLRFDLSADALRDRRVARTQRAP